MIPEIITRWDKNKGLLEYYFATNEMAKYPEYDDIVRLIFDLVINDEDDMDSSFDTNEMLVIDDGNYQGTMVYILHRETYQPCIGDYIYTHNYYGSCSGCDTLQSIRSYEDRLPNEGQIQAFMQLALNLVQQMKYMEEDNSIINANIAYSNSYLEDIQYILKQRQMGAESAVDACFQIQLILDQYYKGIRDEDNNRSI